MKPGLILSQLCALLLVTVLCGLVFVTVQQSHRTGANDPQLQLAEDLAARLEHPPLHDPLQGMDSVDIAVSLHPFVALCNTGGKVIRSNGRLDGQPPVFPAGIFRQATQQGEYAVTWQPRRGVRQALVLVPIPGSGQGFVLAGRSLREVEKREADLQQLILLGWICCSALLIFHFVLSGYRTRKTNP